MPEGLLGQPTGRGPAEGRSIRHSTATVPDLCIGTTKASDGYVSTSPVGQFKPNAFGLYDMHGNACQWSRTGMTKITTANRPQTTQMAQLWGFGVSFVAVPGPWAGHRRSASRYERTPGGRCDKWGFRVARSQ